MIIGLLSGAVLGIIMGLAIRFSEDCPRRVLGYNCRGDNCDHRKSQLYEAKMHMALNDEANNGDYRGGI